MSAPIWGKDYDAGYIGFSFGRRSFLSNAIAYFELPECKRGIHVSHTFVVAGPNDCIEAQPSGVVHSDIESYWVDPDSRIYWHRPKGWTPAMGERIVAAAETMVGDKYGFSIIAAHWLTRNPLGTILGAVTCGWTTRRVLGFMERKGEEVCSEVVAEALRAQPEFKFVSCLNRPAHEITPQRLFDDLSLWDTLFDDSWMSQR